MHGAPHDRHVAPVVVGGVERMDRHQLDHVDAELAQVRQPLDRAGERAGEPADVHLVHDRIARAACGQRCDRRPWPRHGHTPTGPRSVIITSAADGSTSGPDAVGDQPVPIAVGRSERGLPPCRPPCHRRRARPVPRGSDSTTKVMMPTVRSVHRDTGARSSVGRVGLVHGAPAWQQVRRRLRPLT